MDEENKLPNSGRRIFIAPVGSDDFKELPVIENSVKIGFDEGEDIAPRQTFMNTLSFMVDDNPEFTKLMMNSPAVKAQKMLDSIKEGLVMFYHLKPPLNRRERRERARALKVKIIRFKTYCKENGIELKHGS